MSLRDAIRRVVIVVPCYNEASRLQLGQLSTALQQQDDLYLLLVNDGSADSTEQILYSFQQDQPERVTVLSLQRNSGKAEAVRQGMLSAIQSGAELMGYWDADLSTPLSAVCAFREVLASRPDVVLVMGARVQLLGREIQRRPLRHYLGRMFATAASVLLRLAVYDTQCGAKLFRNRADVAKLFESKFISRWIFDVEILARLIRGRRCDGLADAASVVYEYPLDRWVDVAGSKLRPRDFVLAFVDLWRIGRANDLIGLGRGRRVGHRPGYDRAESDGRGAP